KRELYLKAKDRRVSITAISGITSISGIGVGSITTIGGIGVGRVELFGSLKVLGGFGGESHGEDSQEGEDSKLQRKNNIDLEEI
ncbi:hypothetical protein C0J52_19434, partial [Blattella germanica]